MFPVSRLELQSKELELIDIKLQTITQVELLVHVLKHKVEGVLMSQRVQIKGIEVI